MAKVKRVLRCYHCGAILQIENPEEPGYITKSVIEGKKQVLIPYCNNCYESMITLNGSVLDQQIDNDILKVLDDAVATDALIVWVIDLFSFNGTLNPDLIKKLRKQKVWVVGTKRDLFPRSIKKEVFERYISERFTEAGLQPAAIRLVGAGDGQDAADLFKELNEAREAHDIYMIGKISSGKTSLINKFLKVYENKSKRQINTQVYEGTSVKVLEIPLSRSSSFYELPGLSQNTNVIGLVEKDVQKFIIPKRQVKISPKIMATGDCMLVGSLAAFTVVNGRPSTFRLFSAEGVESRKLPARDLDKVLMENLTKKFLRPVSDRFVTFSDFDLFEYEIEDDDEEHDISIEGLGWVQFTGRGQIVRVLLPKGAALKECLSKLRPIKPEKPQKPEKPVKEKPAKPEKPVKPVKEKPAKPEKAEKK